MSLGPVGYWPLDGQPGVDQRDLIAGHPASPTAGLSVAPPIVGHPALAIPTLGSLSVDKAVGLPSSGAFSIAGWCRPRNAGTLHIASRNWVGSKTGTWILLGVGSSTRFQFSMAAADNSTTNSLVTVGTYQARHFAVGVYDGTSIRTYCDGVASSASSVTYATNDVSEDPTIGNETTESGVGDLSDIAFFDRALTASEISRLYATGLV